MIGWLSGRVVHQHLNGAIVLDVNGVGYELAVSSSASYRVGEEVALFVYTVVRADAIQLYGFDSYADREFFELLLITPGVGPSTALAALRTMSIAELAGAIENGDVKRVATIPGIGAKTASRIVLELKGKLVVGDLNPEGAALSIPGEIDEALRGLGYAAQEIRQALDGVTLPDDEAEALRLALSRLRRP
ncbi:MAG: Holliday junction branch migration protein RuvA [Acidimicrobiales bacterium]